MRALRVQDGISAAALEFAILTASRTNEVLRTRWAEIDLAQRLWTLPADRMKAAREHRVPLSAAALAILRAMNHIGQGEYVFPSSRNKGPLSNMALLSVLKRMGRADLTVHGFRSTFRDWVSEATDTPREVAEMALAHSMEAPLRRPTVGETYWRNGGH